MRAVALLGIPRVPPRGDLVRGPSFHFREARGSLGVFARKQEMAGKAEMAKAEQNRRILVEEAKAKLEAEKLNAQAEIERARGMAEAMRVENGTLSETYNQYLFIRTLEKLADKGDLPQIIYVPTNGMVPVMDVSKKSPVKQMQE